MIKPSLQVKLARNSGLLFTSILMAATAASGQAAITPAAAIAAVNAALIAAHVPPPNNTAGTATQTNLTNAITLAIANPGNSTAADAAVFATAVLNKRTTVSSAQVLAPAIVVAAVAGIDGTTPNLADVEVVSSAAIQNSRVASSPATINNVLVTSSKKIDGTPYTIPTLEAITGAALTSGNAATVSTQALTAAIKLNGLAFNLPAQESFVASLANAVSSESASAAIKAQIAKASIALLGGSGTSAAGLVTAILGSTGGVGSLTTFTSTALNGTAAKPANPLVSAGVALAVESDATANTDTIKASVIAAATKAVSSTSRPSFIQALATSSAALVSPTDYAAFAQTIAQQIGALTVVNKPGTAAVNLLTPTVAGKVAIGVALVSQDGQNAIPTILANVVSANLSTVTNAAAIVNVVASAVDIYGNQDLATQIGLLFSSGKVLSNNKTVGALLTASAPALASNLAKSVKALTSVSGVTAAQLTILKGEAIAVEAGILASSFDLNNPVATANQAKILALVKSVGGVAPATAALDVAIAGNLAVFFKNIGADTAFLTKIQNNFIAPITSASIKSQVKAAFASVISGTNPHGYTGAINNPETIKVNH